MIAFLTFVLILALYEFTCFYLSSHLNFGVINTKIYTLILLCHTHLIVTFACDNNA